METLWKDFHYSLRVVRGKPMLTALIALSLALGIGASTAIFSIAWGVALRPLPYPAPERLVDDGAAKAAQRHTLCRRVRHSRGCSTEQSEARNHLERVIERQRGAGQQLDRWKNGHGHRRIRPRQLGARRRDVHRFKERRRL